ncbi:unnamed protein product, partial [Sphagnum tenellum]
GRRQQMQCSRRMAMEASKRTVPTAPKPTRKTRNKQRARKKQKGRRARAQDMKPTRNARRTTNQACSGIQRSLQDIYSNKWGFTR